MKKSVRVITSKQLKKEFQDRFIKEVTNQDLNQLTDGQYSRNSTLAQTKDWNLFLVFCLEKRVTALPASATAVRLYIEKEAQTRKYSTIKRYVVTIGLIHRVLGLPDPTTFTKVREALAKVRVEKRDDFTSSVAFQQQHLSQISAKLIKSIKPLDVRNLAIYYIMFECMLKRSELKMIDIKHIFRQTNGVCTVNIGSQSYSLSLPASDSLCRWISIRGENDGPLFNAVDKHNCISNQRLDDSSIYRIMRSASDKLGLDIQFSGQSARVGSAQEMARLGAKATDIQTFGRWLSPAMPYQYIGNRAKAESEKLVFKSFKPWD